MINTEYLWLIPERGCKYRTFSGKQGPREKKSLFRYLSYFCGLMTDFLHKLFSWYQANSRDFPFRQTTDPYLIWLSEVIMQQTRIEQGVPYYIRFSSVFPTVHDLAAAKEDEVLRQWQGLGYYSRARNLHTTANEIVEKYGGRFPGTYEELRSFKGIGDYTAAAIASVCFGLPYPVMDGNVTRFITRHFGISGPSDKAETKKEIMDVLTRLMNDFRESFPGSPNPGMFNQAMIEFGAIYCVPRNPVCSGCIFRTSCFAILHDIVDKIPLKKPQQPLKPRYFNYLVIQVRGRKGLYLHKRTENDIWKGLYEFPLIETSRTVTFPRLMNSASWKEYFGTTIVKVLGQTTAISHLLSHQKIIAKFFSLEIDKPSAKFGILIHTKKINELPVARILEKFIGNHLKSEV